MSWFYLVIAGLFEIGFVSTLKLTEGFTRLWPSVIFLICIIASFHFLEKSLAGIPIGTAYSIWTGIGVTGTVIIGIVFFKEPLTLWRMFFLMTLIGSIIGLKLVSSH